MIMFHPTQPDFHPVHHPSYIDFYEQVLTETTDPHVMSKQFEERYANDDWYRHLYRTGNAYHGVHPFYMWYWGAHAMKHCGRIIIVGGDPKSVRRLGFVPASTLDDALEIASDVVGRSPTHHPPAQPADPDGGRPVTDRVSDTTRFALRRAARAAGQVERAVGRVTAPGRNVGFPFRAPTIPRGVEVPVEPSNARRRLRHRVGPLPRRPRRPGRHRRGTDAGDRARPRRARGVRHRPPRRPAPAGRRLRRAAPPLIFAPNHHSHLDTALMVRAVPFTWRKRLVVAAAADYFFDKRWKATVASLSLNVVPIDRESTGRKSADMIRELVEDGWSLVIYPEGGRSPDGWGQDFKAGAAYLSSRTGAPGRAGVHRRHRLDLRQGHEAARSRAAPGSCSARRCRRSTARARAASTPASRPP